MRYVSFLGSSKIGSQKFRKLGKCDLRVGRRAFSEKVTLKSRAFEISVGEARRTRRVLLRTLVFLALRSALFRIGLFLLV